MRMASACMLACLCVAPARAQEAAMDPVDFQVDWPSLVGKRVRIDAGSVFAASEDSALLKLTPETVRLTGPWSDREDLRYLFRNCTDITDDLKKCRMPVIGTVAKGTFGVELTGVDFLIPGK